MTGKRILRLALLAAMAAQTACTPLLVAVTQEKASWEFLRTRCDGIRIVSSETVKATLLISMVVRPVMDSAICIYEPRGAVSGRTLRISVKKGLCGGSSAWPLVLAMPKPEAGDYQVVYDDRAAHDPALGVLHVD